ncbi:cell division ATP-binding protein FtsE [bacterium]|nr:cell division ATP-binding protein FtsE [bacterium]
MILFKEVSKVYKINDKEIFALRDVNLEIKKSEFVSLVGKSGAGKTTLLNLLIGQEKPDKGRIFFEEVDITKIPSRELFLLRQKIGMVFQDFRLLANKTASENIAFALEVAGFSQREVKKLVEQLLILVGMKEKADNFPFELSGGERQRIAIARALVRQPDLIIADEPTGNLDPINGWEIINLLLKINELGTTVILATHDKEVVNKIKKRVVILEDGMIIKDDKEGRYIL